MAYIEPKKNWTSADAPLPSDMNRIEGNNKQNHDDIEALSDSVKTKGIVKLVSGSGTWIVPNGVYTLKITGAGGAGGGGGGGSSGGLKSGGDGGDTGFTEWDSVFMSVVPLQNIAYTVGEGGAGGVGNVGANGSAGQNGGNSSFGALVMNGGVGGFGGYITDGSKGLPGSSIVTTPPLHAGGKGGAPTAGKGGTGGTGGRGYIKIEY